MDSSGVSGITEMSSEVAPKNSQQSIGQVSDEFNGKRILRRFDSLTSNPPLFQVVMAMTPRFACTLTNQISPAWFPTQIIKYYYYQHHI